jgi:hypothetical protein
MDFEFDEESPPRELFDIDWASYSEEQIQQIIHLHYESHGYDVSNYHLADRASEKGADLVAKKKTETIAIAVKIKPVKSDYTQVAELSRRSEKRKLYYYVSTPAIGFTEMIKEGVSNVEFKTMRDFLVECFKHNPRLYFELILSNNTKIDDYINESKKWLILAVNNRDKDIKGTRHLSSKAMQQLWRLKDITVELHKSTDHLAYFYEKRDKCDKIYDTKVFFRVLHNFEQVLAPLPDILHSFISENEAFVLENARYTHADSDWLHYGLKMNLSPFYISEKFEEIQKRNGELDEFFKKYSGKSNIADEIEVDEENFNEIYASILKYIGGFGFNLEFRIDNFFKQANGETFERDGPRKKEGDD